MIEQTCPCKKCILLPVCTTKVNSDRFYYYEVQRQNNKLISSDYYHIVNMLFDKLLLSCDLIHKYVFIQGYTYEESYDELRKIYYIRNW